MINVQTLISDNVHARLNILILRSAILKLTASDCINMRNKNNNLRIIYLNNKNNDVVMPIVSLFLSLLPTDYKNINLIDGEAKSVSNKPKKCCVFPTTFK